MKRMLKSLGYRFKQQFVIASPKSFYILDFYLCFVNESGIDVEVDGDHHSFSPAQIGWDKMRTAYLNSIGITVIRINNHALTEPDYAKTRKWLYKTIEGLRVKQSKLE